MKKQNVLIVGGGDSFSKHEDFLKYLQNCELRDLPTDKEFRSWKRWLASELGDTFLVDVPHMPNKENAKYEEWKIWFDRHLELVEDSVILIGLSLGAEFLAKYLIENDPKLKIKGLFLLAGPCGYFDDPDGMDCTSFGFDESGLIKIQEKTRNIIIMHSKDDFVVPYEHALKYHAALPEAELVTFEDKNHFLVEEFPELLEKVRQLSEVR